MIQVQQDGLTYLINEKEEKAEIVGYYEDRNNFLIPRSIKYESQKYIVVCISKNAFKKSQNMKSIEFPIDSELQTIEERAFSLSSIESIFIPASVVDLEEGWCNSTSKLTKVKVDPKNSRYLNYEDKMIICKTTETNENYDKIVFCRRDIKEITIPSFIKTIGSHAFEQCTQLKRINIPSNSELQTIEEFAFAISSITSIFIPPHVTKISENAFFYCNQLQTIDIPSNSELQIIKKEAFRFSSIESIFIPASLIEIEEGWCNSTNKLTTVKVDPRNSRYSNYEDKMIICKTAETNENYDKIVFCRRDIKEITIPSFIKIIGSQAFQYCTQIQQINIPSNSELQTIEKGAFSCSSIKSIFFPASLIDLKDGWCCFTNKLTNVKVDPRNSRYSYLEDKIIICKTTETNENYDKIVFGRRDIKEITIPSFIKIIGSDAFGDCTQLQQINIPSNSELQTIEKGAFSCSSIKSIFIPPHVTKIPENAFCFCGKLQRIDIPSNSELQIIEEKAFIYSSITSIFIPHHVTKISEYAFFNCKNLQIIEFDIISYDINSNFPRGTIIMIPVEYK